MKVFSIICGISYIILSPCLLAIYLRNTIQDYKDNNKGMLIADALGAGIMLTAVILIFSRI